MIRVVLSLSIATVIPGLRQAQPSPAEEMREPSEIQCVLQGVDEIGSLEVVRLEPDGAPSSQWIVRSQQVIHPVHGSFRLMGEPGRLTTLIARPVGRSWYFVEGPFQWPEQNARRLMDSTPRRTLAGALDATAPWPLDVKWLPSDHDLDDNRALCETRSRGAWQCAGVPWNAAGVVLAVGYEGIGFAIASEGSRQGASESPTLEWARWGRFLSILPSGKAVDVSAWTNARSESRRRSLREQFEPNPSVRIEKVGTGFWVVGFNQSRNGFLQIEGAGIATTRVHLSDLASGPPDLPMTIQPQDAVQVDGRVILPDGTPASRALILVSEVLTAGPYERLNHEPKRRRLAEVRSDQTGYFTVSGLARQPYEFLVLDSSWGRARLIHTPDASNVTIRLRRISRISGRVVRKGLPIAGLPVRLRPDLRTFAEAAEPLDYLALEAVTGSDGRFVLALPPAGSSELQLGNDASGYARRRVPETREMLHDIELGDVELGRATPVVATLLTNEPCDLLAAGPMGSSGITMVSADRQLDGTFSLMVPEAGRWLVTARCGGRELLLEPAFIDVPLDSAEMSVQFAVTSW